MVGLAATTELLSVRDAIAPFRTKIAALERDQKEVIDRVADDGRDPAEIDSALRTIGNRILAVRADLRRAAVMALQSLVPARRANREAEARNVDRLLGEIEAALDTLKRVEDPWTSDSNIPELHGHLFNGGLPADHHLGRNLNISDLRQQFRVRCASQGVDLGDGLLQQLQRQRQRQQPAPRERRPLPASAVE